MNELHLFAGAGGGIYASRIIGSTVVCAVENDEYCRDVLVARQNDFTFDPFPIWDDIRTFDGNRWRGAVDIVCGGFPCQAFSTAARGRNVSSKNLWPEMRRVVGEVKPEVVFAENVSSGAITEAAKDLGELGYKHKAIMLSASDLGADHVRRRFWLLAYTDNQSQLFRRLHAKMALLPKVPVAIWKTDPRDNGVVDGMAPRKHRYKASGNGQVPGVVIEALRRLTELASM
jgi:DNA (cytosine-5)-methyltransferase 1